MAAINPMMAYYNFNTQPSHEFEPTINGQIFDGGADTGSTTSSAHSGSAGGGEAPGVAGGPGHPDHSAIEEFGRSLDECFGETDPGAGRGAGDGGNGIKMEHGDLLAADGSVLDGGLDGGLGDGSLADLETRRKAQNRAAQRAFRERKEKKFKLLEERLNETEEERNRLKQENELLRRERELMSDKQQATPRVETQVIAAFPDHTGFMDTLMADHRDGSDPYVVYEAKGERMLGAGAVWQMLMEHPRSDDIDLTKVMSYLKNRAHCDGFGPVFALSDVYEGIRLALASR